MKVIYYRRHVESGFHIHAFSSADMFYIPDEEVVLFREQYGSFGGQYYSLTDRKEILDEIKAVLQSHKVDGVEISNVKEFEYEDAEIRKLIRDARAKSELEAKVRSGIEELLRRSGQV